MKETSITDSCRKLKLERVEKSLCGWTEGGDRSFHSRGAQGGRGNDQIKTHMMRSTPTLIQS